MGAVLLKMIYSRTLTMPLVYRQCELAQCGAGLRDTQDIGLRPLKTHDRLHDIDAVLLLPTGLRRMALLFDPVFKNKLIHHVAARQTPVRKNGVLGTSRPIEEIRRP